MISASFIFLLRSMVGMKGKKVLVTGGAGFVGSHLCQKLLHMGASVIAIDNFYTGTESNLESLTTYPSFSFVHHDVCNPFDFVVDAIFHLACPASPKHYQSDPVYTMKTSVLGAIHVLDLAKKYHVPVLLASTSEVYGDPLSHPQKETYWGNVNPVGIRSCYDEGKRCAETLFFDYHRMYNLPVKIARIFNTYGPRMLKDDGRVVSNFVVQALNHEPITIYGDGHQTRSFCFVDDLVDGLIALMLSDNDFIGPCNLGNPTEYTVKDLADMIIAMTETQSPLVFEPLPQDDPKVRCPDISLAQIHLKWAPKVSVQQGLALTIAYFQHQKNLALL